MGIIKDPTSWRVGFELGLAGFSFPYSKPRKPTAYLYNGVRLPALPEWDREKYPYAAIGRVIYSDGPGIWKFIARDTPFVAYDSESASNHGYLVWMLSTPVMFDNPDDQPNEWVSTTTLFTASLEYLWSNHDVCGYNDGTVIVHEASEPVPVYE